LLVSEKFEGCQQRENRDCRDRAHQGQRALELDPAQMSGPCRRSRWRERAQPVKHTDHKGKREDCHLYAPWPAPSSAGRRFPSRSATTLRGGVSLTFRYSKVQEATFMNTRLLMMLRVNVATPQNLGAVPLGTRRTAPLSGGSFEGPRLRGTVVAGGSADWQVLRSDGVLEMDLRVTLQTDDGALISMRSF